MLEVVNAVSTNDTDGNSFIIVQVVRLSEQQVIKYIQLDKILRSAQENEFSDLMSDYGWSYSNDILGTRNWDSLDLLLDDVENY